jgi:hypothetical protein
LQNILEILRKILESYEFQIIGGDYGYLLGEKEGSSIAAAVLQTENIPTSLDILNLREQIKEDVDKIIFATTAEISQELMDFAENQNILLWDRIKLEEEIGRAVLSGVEGDFRGEGLLEAIKGVKEEPFEEEIQVPKEEPLIEPGAIQVRIEPKDQEEGELIMKPRITMSEVSEISKKIVQGFRFDLELIPYYVYDYSCELVVEGQPKPQISSGTLAVNGLTNSVEAWDYAFDTVSEMEATHTKLEPKFDEHKAYETARESAIALNTREIQTVDDRGAVTIYEKKKVRPKEGAIELVKRGLVYLPVWCVEGSNGVMIIDATTGKVIKEDLFREGDDIYSSSSGRSFSF